MYEDKGNTMQAIKDYSKAIEINPEFMYAYNNRGLAYESIGRISQAIADYKKALELNPNYETARNNLNRLQSK